MLVSVVSRAWMPWSELPAPGDDDLSFDLSCAPLEGVVGEPVTCTAEIRRLVPGGVLMAELGLPPGAEVDRGSLEARSGWARWQVDADRVLAYVSPSSGVARLVFRFTPQLAIEARTPGSRLWDYYSPDRERRLPPLDFVVREKTDD